MIRLIKNDVNSIQQNSSWIKAHDEHSNQSKKHKNTSDHFIRMITKALKISNEINFIRVIWCLGHGCPPNAEDRNHFKKKQDTSDNFLWMISKANTISVM